MEESRETPQKIPTLPPQFCPWRRRDSNLEPQQGRTSGLIIHKSGRLKHAFTNLYFTLFTACKHAEFGTLNTGNTAVENETRRN